LSAKRKFKNAQHDEKVCSGSGGLRGWKLWRVRLLVVFGTPIIFFFLVELALRLVGFGYPTTFLLPVSHKSREFFMQNNQFGWRFFGERMARVPNPIFIPQVKPPDTVRIFVFGESAAFGDPQPDFGLPRMLNSILSLRHPNVQFEVINAAMTGINSHTILPIARDCASAGGDIWVIYMGNNEAVGPFGAGTVFGLQSPPLPLIRASLALKATRTGQWLDSVRQWIQKPPPGKSEWGGMEMFLNQQVRIDDPRMNAVYHHFKRNLADIIEAGRRSGAGIVVSTVAVNLRDCAPFASEHRSDLSESDKTKWNQLYQRGVDAQLAGQGDESAAQFRAASQIDDTVAELHFRQAQCELAFGNISEAQRQFSVARDLDTLRFRCDTRLEDLIRQSASGNEPEHILLADSERRLAEQSPDGLPGEDLFYDHVHLTFRGNYQLARNIASQVEKLLPEQTKQPIADDQPWPSLEDCARRLAWSDWNQQAALSSMFARLNDPPFTGQLTHGAQVKHLKMLVGELAAKPRTTVVNEAQNICGRAAAAVPDDPVLQIQLASLKQSSDDLAGATVAAKRAVELLPCNLEGWSLLGRLFAQQQQFDDAIQAFHREFELDTQDVFALQNLAQSLVKLGRREEAIREYHRALAIKPRFGPAWLGLGKVLEETGRKSEAEDCYHMALVNRIDRAPDLATLARFCLSRGWREAAATNYDDALKLDPSDAKLFVEAGQNCAALGRHSEAARCYASAVQLNPGWPEAHFLYGLELGQCGESAGASDQFRETVRLMPDLLEARLNLGIALANQKLYAESLAEFVQVIQRSPTNTLALKYAQALRGKLAAEPPR
jgi:tetratricopeptide (TPR) repeat protein